jgi:hypothetical protein
MNKQSIVISKYGYNKKNYSAQTDSTSLQDRISRDINLRINNSKSPTPQLPNVEFNNSKSTVPQLPSVEFDNSKSPTPQLPSVEFDGSKSPTPKLPSVEFDNSKSPTPQLPSVEFDNSKSPTPQLPSVEFDNSKSTVPELQSVEFDNSKSTVPELQSVEFDNSSSNNKKIVDPIEILKPYNIKKDLNDILNVTVKNLIIGNEQIQENGFAMEQDILDLFITEVNGEILIPE